MCCLTWSSQRLLCTTLATTELDLLDRVQKRFLREVGLTEEEALCDYHLAPLKCRRDIAVLGLIHRTVLGLGPAHFRNWFFPVASATHCFGAHLYVCTCMM